MKITIGRQQGQVMANTELRQQRINGSDLEADPATKISQICCVDVIFAIRNNRWNIGERQ